MFCSTASPVQAGICAPDATYISPCNEPTSSATNTDKLSFIFCDCLTPKIYNVTPNSGNSLTQIQIHGLGFKTDTLNPTVQIGDHTCQPSDANNTFIQCTLDTENNFMAGVFQMVSVNVESHGFAIRAGPTLGSHQFRLLPMITSVSPSQGSQAGGTQVTISGDGFTDGSVVSIGGSGCTIESVSYTEIVCVTSANSGSSSVTVTFPNDPGLYFDEADCPDGCDFDFSPAVTPIITNVNPTTIGVETPTTDVTISGSGFTDTMDDIAVTIGTEICEVTSASTTEIVCTIGSVPAGSAAMIITISPHGKASFDGIANTITSSATIFNVSPVIGSKKGGTEVTITANGLHEQDTSIMINNKQCVIKTVTKSEVICTTPSNQANEYAIEVTSGGVNFQTDFTFTYATDSTPVLDDVNPSIGKGGDSITISGSR